MDRYPHHRGPSDDRPDDLLEVEADPSSDATGSTDPTAPPLVDRTGPTPAMYRIVGRRGLSLPAALGAAALVTTIALGAAAFRPLTEAPDGGRLAETAGETTRDGKDAKDGAYADGGTDGDASVDKPDGETDGDKPEGDQPSRDKPDADDADQPGETDKPVQPVDKPDQPVDKPEPKPEPKPDPKPEPKPEPKPDTVATLSLRAAVKEKDWVVLEWSMYKGDGFSFYKVVRSTDATVRWPAGDNDTVVGAIEDQGKTRLEDHEVRNGKLYFYRVFAVHRTDAGSRVLAASNVAKVRIPEGQTTPAPEPSDIAFEIDVTDAGVVLHWEKCPSELFAAYKIIRSKGSDPSYLPGTDGSQVIGVYEDYAKTSFTDKDVEAGQTWWYRVQSIGWHDGQKVLLGETRALKVEL